MPCVNSKDADKVVLNDIRYCRQTDLSFTWSERWPV